VRAEASRRDDGGMTDPAAQGLARLAGLLADRTRAAFCLALLDGRAWTAGELARHAGVAASTATEHISALVNGGLLVDERQGRHRYVRLASPRVAQLLEELTGHAGPAPEPPRSLRAASASAAMARGRTCYDHLAGRLGVALTDGMTRTGLLDQSAGFALTAEGARWLTDTVGRDLSTLGSPRRPLVRPCLDWTERRLHLAGAAGAALCQHFMDRGWVVRIGSQRAVRVTPTGATALHELLGVGEEDLDLSPAV
jgi:DNA-binding transcriptional ArsR family regulator